MAKKQPTKQKRKQCSVKGCRKLCADGWEQCVDHKPFDPVEDVLKLTLEEAEKWGRLDAEIRNALQGHRIKALEIQVASLVEEKRQKAAAEQETQRRQAYEAREREFGERLQSTLQKYQDEIKGLGRRINQLRADYEAYTKELANKYKLDVTKIVIDPDVGTIRET